LSYPEIKKIRFWDD